MTEPNGLFKPGLLLDRQALRPYRRENEEPAYRPLRIYTRDPSLKRSDGAVTTVRVPYQDTINGRQNKSKKDERLIGTTFTSQETVSKRILKSSLFSVWVQSDNAEEPCKLDDPGVAMQEGYAPSTTNLKFAAQMAYAVCALTYDRFRKALGRDPDWAPVKRESNNELSNTFKDDQSLQLHIRDARKDATDLANAYYDPGLREIVFGSFRANENAPGRVQGGSMIHTGLSHDIIVHELVHALLDGMKPLLLIPTNPDVLAFHEGFADLVALFMHFTHTELVQKALRERAGELDHTLLSDIAKQFGQTFDGGAEALRTGITDQQDPDTEIPAKFRYAAYLEPHTLGSVLVSAVFEAFRVVFRRKSAKLRTLGSGKEAPEVVIALLAKKATELAEQFLSILIRALDYLAPVDVTFGEYLRALITADNDLVPDDPWGYREALIGAFRRYGITVPNVLDMSEESLRWGAPQLILSSDEMQKLLKVIGFSAEKDPSTGTGKNNPRYKGLTDLLKNHEKDLEDIGFDISLKGKNGAKFEPINVESVRGLRRVGMDDEVALDVIVELSQRSRVVGGAWFYGGATLIIGDNGSLRYLIGKSLTETGRKNNKESTEDETSRIQKYTSFLDNFGSRYSANLKKESAADTKKELLMRMHQHRGHARWFQPNVTSHP